jgi:hypothetical protein
MRSADYPWLDCGPIPEEQTLVRATDWAAANEYTVKAIEGVLWDLRQQMEIMRGAPQDPNGRRARQLRERIQRLRALVDRLDPRP